MSDVADVTGSGPGSGCLSRAWYKFSSSRIVQRAGATEGKKFANNCYLFPGSAPSEFLES